MAVTTQASVSLPLATAERRSIDPRPLTIALALYILGLLTIAQAVSWKQAALFTVGTLAGLVLYHAAFGFTSAWRIFIVDRRGAALRAQMLMLALTCLVFFPVLASGSMFGQTVRGSLSPLSVSVIAGAFIFGIGMQLGGGCASGTLYAAGGGNTRTAATLLAFIAGSVIGAWNTPFWETAPALRPVSLVARFGAVGGLAVSLIAIATIAAMTLALERGRHHSVTKERSAKAMGWRRLAQGPWPLAAGAIGLALVNISTLALAGRPWGVTSAFALWGSKAAAALGMNVAAWPYWTPTARAAELRGSVLNDVTSVMNFGIMIGAFAAAAAAGRFAPKWRVPLRSLSAAIFGGLLLGYGARIAYGCNIGAYFSGVSSGSLHGWLWLASAFAGNIAGTRLRPVFGLSRS